jgi:hypothetical protein
MNYKLMAAIVAVVGVTLVGALAVQALSTGLPNYGVMLSNMHSRNNAMTGSLEVMDSDECGMMHGHSRMMGDMHRYHEETRERNCECEEAPRAGHQGMMQDAELVTILGNVSEVSINDKEILVVDGSGNEYEIKIGGLWIDEEGNIYNYYELFASTINEGDSVSLEAFYCFMHDEYRAVSILIDGTTYSLAHGMK